MPASLLKFGEFLVATFLYAVAVVTLAVLVQQFVEPLLVPPRWRQWLSKLLRHSEILRDSSDPRVTAPGDPPRTLGAVLLSATGLFDRIFGPRHWTMRCFIVSAAFTLVFSAISLALVGYFSISSLLVLIVALFSRDNLPFLLLALVWSAFVDYISLWETRWVIRYMRRDGALSQAIFLLIVDIIWTFFIFLIGAALFKTVLDLYYLIPLLYQRGSLTITSHVGASIALDAKNGVPTNAWLYFWHSVELALLSTLSVLKDLSHSYWTFSLYIGGRSPYIVPVSSLWATAHLFSIFVYIYIALWLMATRMMFLHRLLLPRIKPIRLGRILFFGNMTAEANPVTILVLNVGLYGGVLYFAAKYYLGG